MRFVALLIDADDNVRVKAITASNRKNAQRALVLKDADVTRALVFTQIEAEFLKNRIETAESKAVADEVLS